MNSHPYSVKTSTTDKALPFIVVFNLRSYSNVKGRYATEKQAKARAAKLNRNYLN